MAGTIFTVLKSFLSFQKVSVSPIIEPFQTIFIFFVINHILAVFWLSVYIACTDFPIQHLELQPLFLPLVGIDVNRYSMSFLLWYDLIF